MTQAKALHPALALPGLALLAAVLALGTAAGAQEQPKIEVVPRIPHAGRITSAAFAPDGTRVVTASEDATLKLWDAGSGRLIRTFVRHSNEIIAQVAVAYSSDGTRVLSGSQDGMRLWEVATGRLIRAISLAAGDRRTSPPAFAFSPDGTRVLTVGRDGTAKMWDAATGQLVRTFGTAAGTRAVAFSLGRFRACERAGAALPCTKVGQAERLPN